MILNSGGHGPVSVHGALVTGPRNGPLKFIIFQLARENF